MDPITRWDPGTLRFAMMERVGGMVVRDPMRMIMSIDPPPMPNAPGASDLMAAGWRWDGRTFVLGSAVLDTARVLAGRYAHRLPTNRQAKRAASKSRRRARHRGDDQ